MKLSNEEFMAAIMAGANHCYATYTHAALAEVVKRAREEGQREGRHDAFLPYTRGQGCPRCHDHTDALRVAELTDRLRATEAKLAAAEGEVATAEQAIRHLKSILDACGL